LQYNLEQAVVAQMAVRYRRTGHFPPRRSASSSRRRPENTMPRCAKIDGVETCKVAIQTNNVEVDGMHIVELMGEARDIAALPRARN
jgi:hypothetical protein